MPDLNLRRRDFLKIAGKTITLSLLISPAVRLWAAPNTVSFQNEMPDVTLDTYLGMVPNVKPEGYMHRYVAFTNPGEQLYFAVSHNSTNLVVDFSLREDQQNPGTWYVDVLLQTLGGVSSDTVEFVFSDTPLAIDNPAPVVPEHFKLFQNYPNPFNASTRIDYSLPSAMPVRLSVYNTLGQAVELLDEGRHLPGRHSAVWTPAPDVSSGVYFSVLDTPQGRQSRRMVYRK